MTEPGRVYLSGAGSMSDESAVYAPFLAEAAELAGGTSGVAVILWAPSESDGAVSQGQYINGLQRVGRCNVRIAQLTTGRRLRDKDLDGAH